MRKGIHAGGSVYPIITGDDPNRVVYEKGISLRDYFAIHATDKDVESWQNRVNRKTETREKARYNFADAMLKERTQ